MVEAVADKLTDRKLRLFLVACCRRLPYLADDPRLGDAVEAAEGFAEGACGEEEMQRAAARLRGEASSVRAAAAVFVACLSAGSLRAWSLASGAVNAAAAAVAHHAASPAEGGTDEPFRRVLTVEQAAQCRLLRDVVGDPFRPPGLDLAWLAWDGGTVARIAAAAYEERTAPDPSRPAWLVFEPDRLAVLADALEEAGCTDATLLDHLRGPGPHVRGCHAVDLLLARN
jgi:hypothetical protein